MTVTTNERGQNNMFAKEPPMTFDQKYTVNHNEKAEKLNGRVAMMGIIAALGAYATTGQMIPGIWWIPSISGRHLFLLSLFSGLSPVITMTMMSMVVGWCNQSTNETNGTSSTRNNSHRYLCWCRYDDSIRYRVMTTLFVMGFVVLLTVAMQTTLPVRQR